ncbi:1407_t:CDS:1 [Ambispora gerdemannii]|uniref:1407_t:CDS:1 n=1 Tax=Ambispora gerdemannii TaxID=144530 RepID=A0A9N9F4T1_9GLOM|nr:1407_t:CDS:1 [Ambispora gerdemannii]
MLASNVDQCVPEFQSLVTGNNYDHLQLVQGIPFPYFLKKLHELGPLYLGDKTTAYAELHVEGIDKPFWVHKEYLELQSSFFCEIFENVYNGDVVTISIPSPDTFEAILEFLYDGNGKKWYKSITKDNYYSVWQNVEYLGLSPEAQSICLDFYQNEIECSDY